MKRLSTFLCTLALLLVGASSAKAQGSWAEISKINYSDYTGFPYYVMGYVPEWVEGIMTDYGANYLYKTPEEAADAGLDTSDAVEVYTNNSTKYYRWTTGGGWHQYFIDDGIPTAIGGSYKVKALVKASANVNFNVNMGNWGDGNTVAANVTIPQSNEFVEVEWTYDNIPVTSSFLVAQPAGNNVKIEWKSVTVYKPGVPATYTEILTNGDVEGENSSYSVNENGIGNGLWAKIVSGENGPSVAGTHAVEVKSSGNEGAEWDSQLFLSLPKRIPTGTKFKITFDYKASSAAVAGTQWQNGPGEYVWYSCIGDVNFATFWKTFEKIATVPQREQDGVKYDITPYSIAFNIARTAGPITYYFDNFKFEVLDGDLAGLTDAPAVSKGTYPSDPAFTVGDAGYLTFSYGYPVTFGDDVEAYAAVYNAGGYVELTSLAGAAANTAVILKAAAGNYTANVKYVAAPAENDLLVSDGSVTGNGTIFALGKKNGQVGFAKVKSGVAVPAGKAYLVVPTSVREFIGFGEDATGVETLKQNAKEDNQYFNLAGQRVAQPTKGLYIVNGKKVVIK